MQIFDKIVPREVDGRVGFCKYFNQVGFKKETLKHS